MIEIITKRSKGSKKLGSIAKYTRKAIRRVWFDLGKDLKASAMKEIARKPKSGRVYRIRGPSGDVIRHVSSAPGETHAEITGDLRRSLDYKVSGSGETMKFGYLKNPPPYAAAVEFGTKNMEPRPTLDNAWNDVSSQMERHFKVEMAREFK